MCGGVALYVTVCDCMWQLDCELALAWWEIGLLTSTHTHLLKQHGCIFLAFLQWEFFSLTLCGSHTHLQMSVSYLMKLVLVALVFIGRVPCPMVQKVKLWPVLTSDWFLWSNGWYWWWQIAALLIVLLSPLFLCSPERSLRGRPLQKLTSTCRPHRETSSPRCSASRRVTSSLCCSRGTTGGWGSSTGHRDGSPKVTSLWRRPEMQSMKTHVSFFFVWNLYWV